MIDYIDTQKPFRVSENCYIILSTQDYFSEIINVISTFIQGEFNEF
jgi:hypothetical protein